MNAVLRLVEETGRWLKMVEDDGENLGDLVTCKLVINRLEEARARLREAKLQCKRIYCESAFSDVPKTTD